MAKDRTNCKSAGSGEISCQIGNLPANSSATLYPLVETTDLADGITISGSADLSATNVSGTQSVALGSVDVAVIPNTVQAVVSPNVPVTNTTSPLSSNVPVKVVLKLHKTKHHHHTSFASPQSSNICPTGQSCATSPNPVTVAPESTSLQPLCGGTGSDCLGNATVDISSTCVSTSGSTCPEYSATVSIFFGSTVPNPATMPMYAQVETTTGTFVTSELEACPHLVTEPCLHGKQKKIGSKKAGYALEDTIDFLAGDPAVGIRS